MKIILHGKSADWFKLLTFYWFSIKSARWAFMRVIGYALKNKTFVMVAVFPIHDEEDQKRVSEIIHKYHCKHMQKYAKGCPKI